MAPNNKTFKCHKGTLHVVLLAILFLKTSPLISDELSHAYAKPVTLTPVAASAADGLQHYRLANGRTIAFGPEIIIRLKDLSALPELKKQFKPVATEALSESMLLFTFQADSDIPTLCKQITANSHVLYAHPNIHSRKQLR